MSTCEEHSQTKEMLLTLIGWRQVEEQRNEANEKAFQRMENKMEKLCGEVAEIRRWLGKIDSSLPAVYETRADAEQAYQRLHVRIDKVQEDAEKRLAATIKNTMAATGIMITILTVTINLIMG